MPTAADLTREQLYDLVWTKPIRTLAAEYGLSDVGLAKLCKRHNVPTPARGHWAKLEAGKPVTKEPLPELETDGAGTIAIGPSQPLMPPAAQERLVEIKARTGAARRDPSIELEPVVVPHRSIFVGVETRERAIAVLDALARGLEVAGLTLTPIGKAMSVTREPDTVTFSLKERTRRERHEPTEAEKAAEERRQKRLQQYYNSGTRWNASTEGLFSKAWEEFGTIYTGELAIQIDGWGEGVRRSWRDGKTQRLDMLIDDIVGGIDVFLVAVRARREAWEEERRKTEELQRRRGLAKARQERETSRKAFLDHVQALERDIAFLRNWLTTTATVSADLSSKVGQMVVWAKARLNSLERAAGVEALEADLTAKDLFPDTDNLHDPLGDPPPQKTWW